MEIYIYKDAESYNESEPSITMEVQTLKIKDRCIQVNTSDGLEHRLFNFFAITFEAKEVYDEPNPKCMNIYTKYKSYDDEKPDVEVDSVATAVVKDGFITLYNDYVHIINASKVLAFVTEQGGIDGSDKSI